MSIYGILHEEIVVVEPRVWMLCRFGHQFCHPSGPDGLGFYVGSSSTYQVSRCSGMDGRDGMDGLDRAELDGWWGMWGLTRALQLGAGPGSPKRLPMDGWCACYCPAGLLSLSL